VDVITALVDRCSPHGHCDVVSDIARQYPIPIVCALLGAPPEDWEHFSSWTDDIFKAFSWTAAADTPVILAAWDELDAYIDAMVARRRRSLSNDLISNLIRAEDDGDRLNTHELRMLAVGLLMGGTDTTRNQLAGSVHVLCDYPEQWALLGGEPTDTVRRLTYCSARHPLTWWRAAFMPKNARLIHP
jgi:cytochrome P450